MRQKNKEGILLKNESKTALELMRLEGICKLITDNIEDEALENRYLRVTDKGKVDDLEIDFVAQNREGLKYYQVALSVRDENVLERELKSLRKTGDFYPKYLLVYDMDLAADYDGIKKINIIEWLLGSEQ